MMHLNRIGGFRNMELISPLLLYSAAMDMQKIYSIVDAGRSNRPAGTLMTVDDCTSILPLMRSIYGELIKLNCPVSAASAVKPEALMNLGQMTYDHLQVFLQEIDGRVRDEILQTYAFSLSHAEAANFNPKDPLLGSEVALKFETASFDIDEAGKCHALGRSTAAVFHAFRVLEIGVKAVAKCLHVADLDQPRMKNWGKILEAIEGGIKHKWPKETDRDKGDGELFWEVYTLMLAIKTPRNGTMHPACKYTEQEADRMLRVIGDIMMRLATRIDENGEPKIIKRRVSRKTVALPKSAGRTGP